MIVLLMLIFGVIQVSWAVYSYHLIANAAHEGARYAIVRGSSWGANCDGSGAAGSGWNSSKCTASTTDIANYVASRSLPGVSIAASNVCVQYSTSVPVSAPTSCTANGTPNGRNNVVQVTVAYPFALNVIWWSRTISLSSTSQMVIAQ
jgi:Flp pilus assembly protein TadG